MKIPEIPRVQRFFCILSLETGGYLIAGLNLFLSLLLLLGGIMVYFNVDSVQDTLKKDTIDLSCKFLITLRCWAEI